jgi:preprotein translocase subunit SecD
MKRLSSFSGWVLTLLGLLALAACNTTRQVEPTSAVARLVIEADAGQPAVNVILPVSGVTLRVQPKPVITEFDIVGVAEAQVDMGRCLAFRLSGSAARDLYRLTGTNIGSRLVLVIDGQPLGARVIDRPIEGGVIFIFAEVPDARLAELVTNLNRTVALLQEQAAKTR